MQRYDAKLENIQEWETWRDVCSTMTSAYGSVWLGPGASCSECNVRPFPNNSDRMRVLMNIRTTSGEDVDIGPHG